MKTPDILLLDISLPGRSGLEVLKQIQTMYPSVAVLALEHVPGGSVRHPDDQGGRAGYLHKDSAPQIFEDAMRTIMEGKQYISAELTRLMIEEMAKDDNELPHKSLSDREYEVLLYIGEGKTMTEIANQLEPEHQDRQHVPQSAFSRRCASRATPIWSSTSCCTTWLLAAAIRSTRRTDLRD